MSMWLSDDEDWSGQDGRLQTFAASLRVHGGPSGKERSIGLDLLDASRLRIDLSVESEGIHRRSLCRAMEAIRASVQRIGRTDRLIERIWTDQL
jgi:hypothetical protein